MSFAPSCGQPLHLRSLALHHLACLPLVTQGLQSLSGSSVRVDRLKIFLPLKNMRCFSSSTLFRALFMNLGLSIFLEASQFLFGRLKFYSQLPSQLLCSNLSCTLVHSLFSFCLSFNHCVHLCLPCAAAASAYHRSSLFLSFSSSVKTTLLSLF